MKYIVVRENEDGSLRASNRPFVHETTWGAIAEAERLANLYPGCTFQVMTTFASRKVEKKEENVTVFD